MTHDAPFLMSLAQACDQAADPILQSATDMERVTLAAPGWQGIEAATADRMMRGLRLKEAAHHLRQDAQDPLADVIAQIRACHASGGVVTVNFWAEAQEVVVSGDVEAPRPVSLVQRARRALDRLRVAAGA